MPREKSDRPLPPNCSNLAFVRQFVEIPDDVVFTVEYSIRAAQIGSVRVADDQTSRSGNYLVDKSIGVLTNIIEKSLRLRPVDTASLGGVLPMLKNGVLVRLLQDRMTGRYCLRARGSNIQLRIRCPEHRLKPATTIRHSPRNPATMIYHCTPRRPPAAS